MKKIKTGIFGGTGYTGLELSRLLSAHPNVEIVFITSESRAGQTLRDAWPQAGHYDLVSATEAPLDEADAVFLCLPHTQSAGVAARAVEHGVKVIDLSADLRLQTPESYFEWYGVPHPAPFILPSPYGLPELGRDGLAGADVIANPGCYATAALLGLAPLVRNGLVVPGHAIVIDAKSGASGAGRAPKSHLLFGEIHGNLSPYNIGRSHRHLGEIEQFLLPAGLQPGRLIFSPHLLPTDRGILAAIYIRVTNMQSALAIFHSQYAGEALVDVLETPELATLAHVVRTPRAVLSLTPAGEDHLIVMVAIDNLLKGAASQAVQNFNLMHHLPETTGLLETMAEPV